MARRRASTVKTALRPKPVKLGRAVPASLALHAGVLALLVAGQAVAFDPDTLIDPDEVMIVTAVALPKQTTELAQKEMRTARPPPEPRPEATPDPAREPVEPKPDQEEVKPVEPEPVKDNSQARDDLLNQLRKQAALDALADAPEGARDQARTSPDGIEGATGSSSIGVGDPEYAAYVQSLRQTFASYFAPIQTEALKTLIEIKIDESGKITDWETVEKSGNASFDAAALRAVIKAQRVPPPPEKLREAALNGIVVAFSNQ